MKSSMIWAVALGLLALAAMAAGPPSPFTGHWEGTDPVDGSSVAVSIGGGGEPSVTLVDDDATVACDNGGHATVRGVGDVNGDTLFVEEFTVRCADGTDPFPVSATFTYEPDTGTLTDDTQCDDDACVVYERPGR